jgi:hypothetical protein
MIKSKAPLGAYDNGVFLNQGGFGHGDASYLMFQMIMLLFKTIFFSLVNPTDFGRYRSGCWFI